MTPTQLAQLQQIADDLHKLEGRVSSMEMALTRIDRILSQLLGDTH